MAKRKAAVKKSGTTESQVALTPVQQKRVTVRIKSKSPMIQHQWSEKAKQLMRDKHAGKKTKNRDVRDPQKEGEEAAYRTADGDYGIPLTALKGSLIAAAHRDLGIERTLVKKALFIPSDDPAGILPIVCDEPVIQEDPVRVGAGSADLRYRPYFYSWSADVTFEIDSQLLTTADLLTLIDRAGFGIGVGEWRPEKGGDYGRFMVDRDTPVEEVAI